MDLLIATTVFDKLSNTSDQKEQKDTFVTGPGPATTTVGAAPAPAPAKDNLLTLKKIVYQVLGLLVSIFAAYLSWQCNTAAGESTPLKVFYAIFAFLFGFIYLIFYALFRAGRCEPKVVYVQGPPPVAVPVVEPPKVGGSRRHRK
jgi:hypothetical protein